MTYHINSSGPLSSGTHSFIMYHSGIITIFKKLHQMGKHPTRIITILLRPSLG